MALVEGIVLSVKKIKNDDLLVSLFTKEGLVSFFVFKQNNTKILPINPFCLCQFELSSGKTGLLIYDSGEIIENYHQYEHLETFYVYSVIAEIINKTQTGLDLEDSHRLYSLIKSSFQLLQKHPEHALYILLFTLSKYRKILGYGFYVDGCYKCHTRKNIVGYDLTHQGLVCEQCFDPYSSSYLKENYIFFLVEVFKDENINLKNDNLLRKTMQLALLDDIIYLYENDFDLKIEATNKLKDYFRSKEEQINERKVSV